MQLRKKSYSKKKIFKVQKRCEKGGCYIVLNFIASVLDLRFLNSSQRVYPTDTGSLIYGTETENVYNDFSKNKQIFGFSNYSPRLKCYGGSNTLVSGKMKDETGGTGIQKCVELKPKRYYILVSYSGEYEKKKV